MEKKFKYGQQVLVLLLLCLGMALLGSVAMVLLQLACKQSMTAVGLLWMQAFSQILMFVLPLIFLSLMYKINIKEWWQLDFSGSKWGKAGVGIVILVVMLPMIEYLTFWNDSWHFGEGLRNFEALLRNFTEQQSELMEDLLAADTIGRLILDLFVIALVPAVCEELFFRGGIQQLLTKWFKNGHVAIWVTAAVFSLFHGDVFAFMPRFILGAILGYVFYYGGSMVINSTMHFVNNATVVIVSYLYGQGIIAISPNDQMFSLPTWTLIACTVAGIALLYTMFIMGHHKQKIE